MQWTGLRPRVSKMSSQMGPEARTAIAAITIVVPIGTISLLLGRPDSGVAVNVARALLESRRGPYENQLPSEIPVS